MNGMQANLHSVKNGYEETLKVLVPPCDVSVAAGLKITVTGFSIAFEEDVIQSPVNWVLNYCTSTNSDN